MPARLAIAFLAPLLAGAALGWRASSPPPQFISTFCASLDAPAGVPLDEARFRPCAFPRPYLAGDVITALEPLRTLDRAVRKGEPVRKGWLGPPRAAVELKRVNLPLKLRRGDTPAPYLEVGDFVDVISVSKDPKTNVLFSMHAAQLVLVTDIVPAGADELMVALSVTAEEAGVLAIAQRSGRLVLTLRNPDDVDIIEEKGKATIDSITPARMQILFMKSIPHCVMPRGPAEPTENRLPEPSRRY